MGNRRLIDANRLKAELRVSAEYHEKRRLGYYSAITHIDEQPTVDAVELPKGKPGDYLEWDNGTGFRQIYHIHSVMICEDCMRYDLEKLAPVVNHPNIVRILSREEAEKEWHERCAREKAQEEPNLTAERRTYG